MLPATLSLLGLIFVSAVLSYNNGYGRTPFLGWNTWCAVGECGLDLCTDRQIRQTADAFVTSGMLAMGYQWLVLDDCWHPTRAANGSLIPLVSSFPNGMKVVVDYVHSRGLKFGLYTSVGDLTCRNNPGSYGYYRQDANLFASWGVDYVKMDWCGGHRSVEGHKEFSHYLNATGRPIVLELCRGPYQSDPSWGYAPAVSQLFRAGNDHHDNWQSTLYETSLTVGKAAWSKAFGWAYLDMLMTGGQGCKGQSPDQALHCPGQTDNEYRTEYSLFALVSSPLLIGTDIRNITSIMRELIFNTEIIAVNQDNSIPADLVSVCGGKNKVWLRRLSDGRYVVGATNYNSTPQLVAICFADLKIGSKIVSVRDLWKKTNLGSYSGSYSRVLDVHDTMVLALTPK